MSHIIVSIAEMLTLTYQYMMYIAIFALYLSLCTYCILQDSTVVSWIKCAAQFANVLTGGQSSAMDSAILSQDHFHFMIYIYYNCKMASPIEKNNFGPRITHKTDFGRTTIELVANLSCGRMAVRTTSHEC